MHVIFIFIYSLFCIYYVVEESKLENNTKRFINSILVITFSTIIACRPLSVPDTTYYVDMYKQINVFFIYPVENLMVNIFDFEIGYVVFSQAAKFLVGGSYRTFLFIIPIINITLMGFGSNKIMNHVNEEYSDIDDSRKSEFTFAIILCLYTSYFGLMYNGIVLRAGIALSLSVCALAMYLDKKYLKMIIFCCIAVTFHRLAVIGIITIIVFKLTPILSRWGYFIVWLMIGILIFSNVSDSFIELILNIVHVIIYEIDFLSSFDSYLINYSQNAEFGFTQMFFYALGLILLIWKVDSIIYYKILNIYYFGLMSIALLSNISGASRISDFMTIYVVVLFYILYKQIKPYNDVILIIIFAFILIGNIFALRVWGYLN